MGALYFVEEWGSCSGEDHKNIAQPQTKQHDWYGWKQSHYTKSHLPPSSAYNKIKKGLSRLKWVWIKIRWTGPRKLNGPIGWRPVHIYLQQRSYWIILYIFFNFLFYIEKVRYFIDNAFKISIIFVFAYMVLHNYIFIAIYKKERYFCRIP